jgi:flavodoxin
LKKREGSLGWVVAGKDSMQEKEAEIAPTKLSPADYDLIVLGTPIWAWRPTPAIRTYIKQNDLSGKKVALFFTLDESLRQTVEKTKELLPNSTLVGELVLYKVFENKEETKNKIARWCQTLKE